MFGWGCGCESWLASRGGEGEGGGALGSSHSARTRDRNRSATRHPHPSASAQVNGYTPAADAMRIRPRYHASRGGQCASRELLGSFGRQLLAVWREARYITRMCPFRPRSRHMQLISGEYWKLVFSTPSNCSVLISGTCGVRGSISMLILCVLMPSLSLHCSAKRRRAEARKEG